MGQQLLPGPVSLRKPPRARRLRLAVLLTPLRCLRRLARRAHGPLQSHPMWLIKIWFSLFDWWFSLARPARRMPPSASLATDQSGHAASGRSGHLVSTPAPSALSVASPAGRRTRNRLVCWTLAPGGSTRGAGRVPSKTRARFAPRGTLAKAQASARRRRISCAVERCDSCRSECRKRRGRRRAFRKESQ